MPDRLPATDRDAMLDRTFGRYLRGETSEPEAPRSDRLPPDRLERRAGAMTAKHLVLREAMTKGAQIMPRASKRPSGLWLILNFGRFGEFTGDTEEDAWARAAASVEDTRPTSDHGYRASQLWADELETSLGGLQPAGVTDYDDGARNSLEELKRVVKIKLEALRLDGER